MIKDYKTAKNKLLTFTLNSECQSFFEKHGYILELAYSKLLTEHLKEAKNLFNRLSETEKRAHWGSLLSSLLMKELTPYPTYFELRNYLEIDLNLLINYHKDDYVAEILNYADAFASINPETHKYIGRVLFHNNLNSWAKFFLERGKNILYQDPELHVIIAELYLKEGNNEKALRAVNACLARLPNYFPALKIKQKLNKNCL